MPRSLKTFSIIFAISYISVAGISHAAEEFLETPDEIKFCDTAALEIRAYYKELHAYYDGVTFEEQCIISVVLGDLNGIEGTMNDCANYFTIVHWYKKLTKDKSDHSLELQFWLELRKKYISLELYHEELQKRVVGLTNPGAISVARDAIKETRQCLKRLENITVTKLD